MFEFLYHTSDTKVFLFLIFVTVSFSLILIFLNKLFIFYKLKYRDNTTTGSIASLIGIIYGVLVGFNCLYLLNNQDHATVAVRDEASAAANIYRDSRYLKEPVQQEMQAQLKNYLKNVVSIEWPEMSEGKDLNKDDTYIITTMSDIIVKYPIVTQTDAIIVNDLIQEIKSLFKGRQDRILMSQSQLSPDMWEVILIGTILIIVINYAFRVNFYLHVFGISAFAVMAASLLFLLVTLDRPFQGEFFVGPDPIQAVIDTMRHDGK